MQFSEVYINLQKELYAQEDLPAEHEGKPRREGPHRMLPAKLHLQGPQTKLLASDC